MPTLNIVLVEPQIPQNSGNIARTCAVTGARLHIVGPMGFTIDDKKLKRAGLDYWHQLDITYYQDQTDFFAKNSGPFFYFTSKGPRRHVDVTYPDGAYLVFGREDAGLPEELLAAHEADCVRMPMRRGERCLNLSNAVAVGVYEALRQWDFAGLETHGQLTRYQFYQMMRDAQGVPTTAAITQLQFCDIYARYADEGYTDLVYLSINAGGSSTYNNAVKAMELLEEERPGYTMKIQVIDSHTYSMPYGWYFCECARKVRNGGELASCVAELKQKLDCVEICLAAYSLKQMKKSGRVSAAAAVVGDLLGIRPIISLNAGVSKVESKVRGDAAVPAAMIKWVESRVDSMKDTPYMVAYTSSTAKRDELVKLCKKAFGHAPLIVFQLGGVVSANTGPDGIAIVYEGKPRNLEAYAPELP